MLWDLYNEPGQRAIFSKLGVVTQYDEAMTKYSRDLMVDSFRWAREVMPTQPLTVAAWRTPEAGTNDKAFDDEIDRLAIALSDVITFHAYCSREVAEKYLTWFQTFGRPVMSTEWMARTIGSKFEDQLDMYHASKAGCFQWGMVQGRTQTHLPWPHTVSEGSEADLDENAWFHDLLRNDGTPFNHAETELISQLTQPRKTYEKRGA